MKIRLITGCWLITFPPTVNRIFTALFHRTITTFFSHGRNFFLSFSFTKLKWCSSVCCVQCAAVTQWGADVQWCAGSAACSVVQRGAVRCSVEQWGAVSLWGAVCLTPPVNVQCSVEMLAFCYKISIFTLRFFTSRIRQKFFFQRARPPISFSLDFHFISDFTDRRLSFVLRL